MAKINIVLNNKTYEIEESALTATTTALKQYFSSTMSGTGATISFGGVVYNIDSTKLSAVEDSVAAYLTTLTGETPEEERLEGDGQEFYTMAPSTLSFRSTAPLNELQDVQINGQTVDPSNYELEEGSTIVKLKHDYLSTLDTGKYEVSVVSDSKTVKGDFTVTAPELNEYGFYYNQPYYAKWFIGDDMGMFSATGDSAILLNPDGTVHIHQIDTSNSYNTTYTYTDGIISIGFDSDQTDLGVFSGSFSNHGKSISGSLECPGAWSSLVGDVVFNLAPMRVACDDTYVYYRSSEDSTTWNYFPHRTTLINYPAAKTNLLDMPVTSIDFEAFHLRKDVESVVIPNSVTTIDHYAFYGCTSLTSINFEGTIAQWNAITLGGDWNYNVPATYVQCSDGQVAI